MTARSILRLSSLAVAVFATFPTILRAATLVVGDGGSISTAIASASTGDTIEIQSNQFFNETLTWQNKFLNVRAGAGFTPHVSRIDSIHGSSGTGGNFTGLTIDDISLGTTGTRFSDITLRQNTINNQLTFSGTGDYAITTLFEDNVFNTKVRFGGTGDMSIKATLQNNIFNAGFISSGTGEAVHNITARHNTSHGDFNFVGTAVRRPRSC